jgi:hypothetical protein
MPQLGATLSLQSIRQSGDDVEVLQNSSSGTVSGISIVCTGASKAYGTRSVVPSGSTVNFSLLSGPATFSGGVNGFTLTFTGIGQIQVLQVVQGIPDVYSDGVSVLTLPGVNC